MTSPTTDRRLGLVGNTAMKAPVTVLADSNITLSGEQTIDGIAVLASNASGVPDRVLCVGQTDATQNGIWDVSASAWTRSLDANGNYDFTAGTTVLVTQGDTYAGSYWKISTTGSITIGTTSLSWTRALASALSTLSFLQAGTGAVTRGAQDKMRDYASFEDFGAVGGGVVDDLDALVNTIASGKRILGTRRPTYLISDQITITEQDVDFGGAILLYRGPKDKFAMVINAASGTRSKCNVRNFVLNGNDTDTATRTHGINVGGGSITLENVRIEGFTGISLGLGSGAESYTGVTLPATSAAFYCEISKIDIAPTAGWGIVVPFGNNANRFDSISFFPWNGFSEAPPRTANCIDELVIGGNTNTFDRVSLEASPSNRMVLFLSTANNNVFDGVPYLECNPNWATPPYPRIEAQAGSSRNRLHARHSYSAVVPISDLGTSNDLRIVAGASINGSQVDLPRGGVNMVKNGRFENGGTNWSDFSTAGTLSYGTGYLSGKSMRVDVVAGRPNISQSLVTVGGYQLTGLQGKNVTISAFIKTNLAGVSAKVVGQTQNTVPNDEAWHWFTSTTRIPDAAASANINLITEASGLTGYVEWSDVVMVFGNEPQTVGTRDPLEGSATYNPPSLADGAGATTTVTVTGAALGDYVAGVSFGVDLQGITVTGWVSAADTVSVRFQNETGGVLDLASSTLRVRVQKA